MEWKETSFSFGKIKEANGFVTHRFVFKNIGSAPLKIDNVQASCGCTTPNWSQTEVAPGQDGFVDAIYNPMNRPGPFLKTLDVRLVGTTVAEQLKVSGEVEGRPKSLIETYNDTLGPDLHMLARNVGLGRISPSGAAKLDTVRLYNPSKYPVNLKTRSKTLEGGPAPWLITSSIGTIGPNGEGWIALAFQPEKRGKFGNVTDLLEVTTEGKEKAIRNVFVSVQIEDEQRVLSPAEAAKAPKLAILTPRNVSLIRENPEVKMLEGSIEIENRGKGKLNLHHIKFDCPCVRFESKPSKIKPGKVTKFAYKVDLQALPMPRTFFATIYSDDASEPTANVLITVRDL